MCPGIRVTGRCLAEIMTTSMGLLSYFPVAVAELGSPRKGGRDDAIPANIYVYKWVICIWLSSLDRPVLYYCILVTHSMKKLKGSVTFQATLKGFSRGGIQS
jgi:hypothetical protein